MYNVFKIYMLYKKNWWSLTPSWPDEVQKMFSTAYESLSLVLIPYTIFMK